MTQYTELLLHNPLFHGLSTLELDEVLGCLRPREKTYEKGDLLLLAGDRVQELGIVLEGEVQVERGNAAGDRAIIAKIGCGGMFAESFACAGTRRSPVSAVASARGRVMWLSVSGLIGVCPRACAHHEALVKNMMRLLAGKNILLHDRLELLSKKTIRERIETYLAMQSAQAGGTRFCVPFSRAELADYLCVDRSALSRELGAMRDGGMIRFHRSEFELLRPGANG